MEIGTDCRQLVDANPPTQYIETWQTRAPFALLPHSRKKRKRYASIIFMHVHAPPATVSAIFMVLKMFTSQPIILHFTTLSGVCQVSNFVLSSFLDGFSFTLSSIHCFRPFRNEPRLKKFQNAPSSENVKFSCTV